MIDDLDLEAGAIHLLDCGWDIFSRKQTDHDDWWIMLQRPDKSPSPKYYGTTMGEALDNAIVVEGLGGLKWSMLRLEVRIRALTNMALGKPQPRKSCQHGTTTKCNQCSG